MKEAGEEAKTEREGGRAREAADGREAEEGRGRRWVDREGEGEGEGERGGQKKWAP